MLSVALLAETPSLPVSFRAGFSGDNEECLVQDSAENVKSAFLFGAEGLRYTLHQLDEIRMLGPSSDQRLTAEICAMQGVLVNPLHLPRESSSDWGDSPPQSETEFLERIGIAARSPLAESGTSHPSRYSSPAEVCSSVGVDG